MTCPSVALHILVRYICVHVWGVGGKAQSKVAFFFFDLIPEMFVCSKPYNFSSEILLSLSEETKIQIMHI